MIIACQDGCAQYNQLIAQGRQSLSAALKVGAAIKEIDIRDLQMRSASTTHIDILSGYARLQNASYNHLRAFTRMLANQTGEAYQSIIAGSNGQRGGMSDGRRW